MKSTCSSARARPELALPTCFVLRLLDKARRSRSAVTSLHVRHQRPSGVDRNDLVDFQKPYAHQHARTRDFVAAIESIKPTTIIGVSTIGGAFNQKVVESMARINDRPVILALSNPTEHAECTAEQAYTWSKGKAIYAAGVQFAPVHYNGQTFLPDKRITSTYSRGWYGDLRHASEACHRRDVYRSRSSSSGSSAVRFY